MPMISKRYRRRRILIIIIIIIIIRRRRRREKGVYTEREVGNNRALCYSEYFFE